jgi:putative ABC transport system permease protein
LILSQPDAYDLTMSAVPQEAGAELTAMPEVRAVSGMLQGLVRAEGQPYFFVFAYTPGSFELERYQLYAGDGLYARAVPSARGTPVLLGTAAAESLHKRPGDTLRLNDRVFRVIGLYQTGNALEDGSALLRLDDAQQLLGQTRQVSVYYIQLKDPALRERLSARVARIWPNLALSGARDLAGQEGMLGMLRGVVVLIAGLAVLIGGVGLANAQLMAVFERTREIGVLRAVGWSRARVLVMILGESVLVCALGGVASAARRLAGAGRRVGRGQGAGHAGAGCRGLAQAAVVVAVLGLAGGLYGLARGARAASRGAALRGRRGRPARAPAIRRPDLARGCGAAAHHAHAGRHRPDRRRDATAQHHHAGPRVA